MTAGKKRSLAACLLEQDSLLTDLAVQLGNAHTANIVALGAFVAHTRLVDMLTLRTCVKSEFSKKTAMIPLNLAAIEEGQKAVMASAYGLA